MPKGVVRGKSKNYIIMTNANIFHRTGRIVTGLDHDGFRHYWGNARLNVHYIFRIEKSLG